MRTLYEFNLSDENGIHRVSIYPREYEEKITNMQQEYFRINYREPTYLVVSSLPHKALCALPFLERDDFGPMSLDKVEEFRGMKVIHLKRWDKEIIEVG